MQLLPKQDSFVSLKGNSLTTNAIHFTSAATTHGRFVPKYHPNESACKLDITFDVQTLMRGKKFLLCRSWKQLEAPAVEAVPAFRLSSIKHVRTRNLILQTISAISVTSRFNQAGNRHCKRMHDRAAPCWFCLKYSCTVVADLACFQSSSADMAQHLQILQHLVSLKFEGLLTANECAEANNLTVVRMFAYGVGYNYQLQEAPGQVNASAFQDLDFIISEAGKRNLKLLVSLSSNWVYGANTTGTK